MRTTPRTALHLQALPDLRMVTRSPRGPGAVDGRTRVRVLHSAPRNALAPLRPLRKIGGGVRASGRSGAEGSARELRARAGDLRSALPPLPELRTATRRPSAAHAAASNTAPSGVTEPVPAPGAPDQVWMTLVLDLDMTGVARAHRDAPAGAADTAAAASVVSAVARAVRAWEHRTDSRGAAPIDLLAVLPGVGETVVHDADRVSEQALVAALNRGERVGSTRVQSHTVVLSHSGRQGLDAATPPPHPAALLSIDLGAMRRRVVVLTDETGAESWGTRTVARLTLGHWPSVLSSVDAAAVLAEVAADRN